MTSRHHAIIDSPIGPLTIVVEGSTLRGLFMEAASHPPTPAALGPAGDEGTEEVRRQLEEYFAGERRSFDLPLAGEGSAWQRQVWAGLQSIPYGQTLSYGELAARLGRPGAARAVGLANGRNPISIVVPCHRVIGADGGLTGYGGGVARKRFLLALEGAVSASAAPTLFGDGAPA